MHTAVTPAQRGRASGREEQRARRIVATYRASKHWVVRAIALTSLGERWHPLAAEIVVDALGAKRPEPVAFAVEALHRTAPQALPAVMSRELVDELVRHTIASKWPRVRERALAALARAFPAVGAEDRDGWRSWWRRTRKDYVPVEFVEPPLSTSGAGRTSAAKFVERAFDLSVGGMQLALVIDSTGSMQPTIDAARAGLREIVSVLRGIDPGLEVGLVHYKDIGELPDGAQVLVDLTDDAEKVEHRLGTLVAAGGGDMPEAVDGALALALSGELGWKPAANKVVVVIGDAPPHPENVDRAVELARGAFENPFGEEGARLVERRRRGRTSAKRVLRPFVVAAIGVAADRGVPACEPAFRRVAQAGGGAYVRLELGGVEPEQAATAVVRRILALAFGSEWSAELEPFLDIYLDYRARGTFRR